MTIPQKITTCILIITLMIPALLLGMSAYMVAYNVLNKPLGVENITYAMDDELHVKNTIPVAEIVQGAVLLQARKINLNSTENLIR